MPTFIATPKCPQCQAKMVRRTGKRGEFWGCSRFRDGCRGTREVMDHLPPFDPKTLPPASPEQKSIWDFLATGDENGLVEARAGSGKTYTITNGIYQLRDQKIAVFSFNNHIIKELNAQLKAKGITWVRGLTYNSFGFKAVKTAFPDAELFKDKLESVLIELHPHDNEEGNTIRTAAEKLTRLCKCYMEDGTDAEVLAELIDRFNIDLGNDCTVEELEARTVKVMNLVPAALKVCLNRKSIIDFDDQVWFTVMLNLPGAITVAMGDSYFTCHFVEVAL
jgi:ssDNA-binding Zn-finger/Zn-ribbon topoisomerase 1